MFLLDCGDPTAMPGYVRGIYSSTTFASAATMYCATGYTGTAAGITCEATGDWSPQIGCTIVGRYGSSN